jgi:hypothetical protein
MGSEDGFEHLRHVTLGGLDVKSIDPLGEARVYDGAVEGVEPDLSHVVGVRVLQARRAHNIFRLFTLSPLKSFKEVGSRLFNIHATSNKHASQISIRTVLQPFLAECFHLRAHPLTKSFDFLFEYIVAHRIESHGATHKNQLLVTRNSD